MSDALKAVYIGMGTIGLEIIRAGARAGIAEPVACADISPEIADKPLRAVAQDEDLPEMTICASMEDALEAGQEAGAEIAVVCTGSQVEAVEAQFTAVLERGMCCISTCEELVFPWLRAASAADRLDSIGVENGVALLGAGVNPGFVLDLFPFVLTRVCQRVEAVFAGRSLDASRRREQLQAKIGSGMRPDEFRELASEGKIGHVGLAESAALLADSLGWQWDDFTETIDPVIAEEPIETEYFSVAEGQVRGQHQTLTMGDVELELIMALGEDERDEVRVDGRPPVHAIVEGGIHGDTATAGAVINFMRPLVNAKPGLRTVTDVPLA
jgi:2,4-diaminopentanoate dehydrogenase